MSPSLPPAPLRDAHCRRLRQFAGSARRCKGNAHRIDDDPAGFHAITSPRRGEVDWRPWTPPPREYIEVLLGTCRCRKSCPVPGRIRDDLFRIMRRARVAELV